MNKRKVIGAILGIILYGVCIVFFTYAYYNWKSDNTTVGLNITDTSLEVEFETGSDVNALNIGPVLDYNDGESTIFKIKNPTENPIRMNVSLDITTISDNLKNKDFKYKLLVDRTGETNFIEEVINGDFSNLTIGINELLLASVVPGNSTYNYKFIVYIDGNVQNNNNLQENTLESNLIITENSIVMITFDSNGGEGDITEKEAYIGQIYGELPIPTKTGYTFEGWYTEKTGGEEVTSTTEVTSTSNQTLYARWTPKAYTVTFEDNRFYATGKTENGLTISYDSNTSYLTLNGTPTASVYDISIDSGHTFIEGEKYKMTFTYVSGSFTNNDSYSFPIDIKNGSSSLTTRNYIDAAFPKSGSSSVTLTVSSTGASEGNSLVNWLWINSSGAVTFNNYVVKVTVTKVESKEVVYGSTYGDLPTLTRPGYVFNGWYTASSGGTKVTSSSSVEITANQTLYAQWTAKTIAVTYYRNTSTSDTTTASQTFTYGATGNKFGYNTDGTPTWTQSGQFGKWDRTGYTLLGWSDERTATAKKWNIYSGVNDSWIDTHYPSINLYAIWKANPINLISSMTSNNWSITSQNYGGSFSFTQNSSISMSATTKPWSDIGVKSTSFNITDFSTITINLSNYSPLGYNKIGLVTSSGTIDLTSGGTFNISSYTGSAYLTIYVCNGYSGKKFYTASLTITNITLS